MTEIRAKIYKPAKTAMQSGTRKTDLWLLEYERPAPGRPDALMGWNTMQDTITEVKLFFPTREEAVAYAKAKNLTFTVTGAESAGHPAEGLCGEFQVQPPPSVRSEQLISVK